MIAIYLILILLFCFLLVKATDILVINLKGFTEHTGVGKFAITSLLLALATSLPELFVSLASALEGKTSLALGNVIGSNIADLSLIIGGAALLGGGVAVKGDFLKKDVFYAFLAGAMPMLLLFDKQLSRIDALILLAVYGFYNVWVFAEGQKKLVAQRGEGETVAHRLMRSLNHRESKSHLAWIFLGIVLLLFSAEMIVHFATKTSSLLNLPLLVMGLIIVAIGTSLPELAFESEAIKAKQSEMAFGDLLGSIVANGTLIIGLSCLISPIKIQAFGSYLLATMAFVIIFATFYFFIRSKRRLDRWEGVVLMVIYLIFALVEFTRS